ncbi:YibE/F family protein [Demetria terragena]|uniref:YibE/F family protein n=1 Tax=Demetria terragena TaxID=63959 RepID=UPI000365607C|nr:YibE/F family protein [Demetria terragena]
MGVGHGHGTPAEVHVPRRARAVLIGTVVVLTVATIIGLILLWPSGEGAARSKAQAQYAQPGVTFPEATVVEMLPVCPEGGEQGGADPSADAEGNLSVPEPTCGAIRAKLDSGRTVAVNVPPEVTKSGVAKGDTVLIMRVPPGDEPGGIETFNFIHPERSTPLAVLAVAFVLLVAAIARLRGLLALVGLVVGGFVIMSFMLPALLDGSSGLWVAVVGSSAIMIVVLYLAHGISLRTSAALVGTVLGVAITAVIGIGGICASHLTGIADDDGAALASVVRTLDPHQLLTAAIIVAGLGVLNDVTITQASAVWELRAASPLLTRTQLFSSGMRIGRDHIASTIYTIVFAYAGAALPVLLLMSLYERPALELIQQEALSEEIIRTISSAIGLVLAVPITTAIAAVTVAAPRGAQAISASDSAEPLSPADPAEPAEPLEPPRSRAEARARREGR